MATSDEHNRLVSMAARWFRRQGFSVIATELKSYGNREQPDVYACRQTCSAVIEVKVSRSDFFADAQKPERHSGGLGNYRFYLCPEGMITPDELPPGWGLLYAKGKGINTIHAPTGNLWPNPKSKNQQWALFSHEADHEAERAALFSIARRLAAGQQTYN